MPKSTSKTKLYLLKNFDACFLCLSKARNPVCCPKGHVACKECFYESILQQKRQSKRLQSIYNKQLNAKLEREASKRQEELDKKALEFANKHNSLLYTPIINSKDKGRGEKVQSFWVPSLASTADAKISKKPVIPTAISCPATLHPLESIRQIVNIRFCESGGSSSSVYVCPCCRSTLTNTSIIHVLNPCGHTVCSTCFDYLSRDDSACPTCSVCQKQYNTSIILDTA